ncbi:MAG: fumarylacetoacetate hydrolase family protein [Chitinophagales bacterium]
MKIFCIGRNYAEHAKELNNPVPKKPLIFSKPQTALVRENRPFFYPEFSNDIHHEIELVIKISKLGKHIAPKFAHKYYNEITLGIDFTARDLQNELKAKGQPWLLAKGFDGSAPVGKWLPIEEVRDVNNIDFSMTKNGETVQAGNTKDLLFTFDYLITYLSQFFTLQKGDLIFTGTPEGVGPVAIGDRLEGFLGEQKLLECDIK